VILGVPLYNYKRIARSNLEGEDVNTFPSNRSPMSCDRSSCGITGNSLDCIHPKHSQPVPLFCLKNPLLFASTDVLDRDELAAGYAFPTGIEDISRTPYPANGER